MCKLESPEVGITFFSNRLSVSCSPDHSMASISLNIGKKKMEIPILDLAVSI